jgi:predicted chitinase
LNNILFQGVVENRNDPMKLGRCQVRIVGMHTHNKTELATADLPWAYPVQPITSAAMSGIGHTPIGPVPGTWVIIMFRDDEQQEPIMLGTIGGIPQTKQAQQSNKDNSSVIASDSGTLIDSGGNQITTGDGTPITVGSIESTVTPSPGAVSVAAVAAANSVVSSIFAVPIPRTPPAGSTTNSTLATANISLLLSTCDELGLTSKYAKCAILGIVGGESKWMPVEEDYQYSQAFRLANIFKMTFKDSLEEAQKWVNWRTRGLDKKEFFNKVYNSNGNGKNVGNKFPDDGGKYFGRGFNQITGRSGYQEIQTALANKGIVLDLMNHPELLNIPTNAARACVMFYLIHVKHDMNDPGYFAKARARTGNDVPPGYAKKQEYYEYFLGQAASVGSTNKPATDSQKIYTPAEIASAPIEKQAAYSEDRSGNETLGFCDPTGKYPLRNLMDEPDTNRMARGIIESTATAFKDATRTIKIQGANNGGTWEQPLAPFGGVYPYNKVYESESGHVTMIDDSPGNETTSTFHRKGTFTDVDANGTQVNKIVGDGYIIMDRNGSIYIAGTTNVTFGGYTNIMCLGAADVEINGQTTINVNNDVKIGVAGDVDMAVGGNFSMKVDGNYNVEVGKDHNLKVAGKYNSEISDDRNSKIGGDYNIESSKNHNLLIGKEQHISTGGIGTLKVGQNYNVEVGGDHNLKMFNNLNVNALGDYNLGIGSSINAKASGNNNMTAAGDTNIFSSSKIQMQAGGDIKITSSGTQHLKAIGNLNIDCLFFDVNGGSASPASIIPVIFHQQLPVKSAPGTGSVAALLLTAPAAKSGNGTISPALETPERDFAGVASFETDEELTTPEGLLSSKIMSAKTPPGVKGDPTYNGSVNATASPIAVKARSGPIPATDTVSAGGVTFTILNDIKARTEFPATYKLSKNFTIANLTGGLPILVDKQLPGNRFDGKSRLISVSKQVENMAYLSENVLEGIYGIYGPTGGSSKGGAQAPGKGIWQINDGLRRGTTKSEHCEGCAVDIRPINRSSEETYNMAKSLVSGIRFNELLLEYRTPWHIRTGETSPAGAWWRWIHISHRPAGTGNTGSYSTYLNDKSVAIGILQQIDPAKL